MPFPSLYQHLHAWALAEKCAIHQPAASDFVPWQAQCLLQQISEIQRKLQASQLFACLSLRCLVGAEEDLSLSMDNQKIWNYGTDAKNGAVGRGRGKLHLKQPTWCPHFLLLLQRTIIHHSPQDTPGKCWDMPGITIKQEVDGGRFDPPLFSYEEITR